MSVLKRNLQLKWFIKTRYCNAPIVIIIINCSLEVFQYSYLKGKYKY